MTSTIALGSKFTGHNVFDMLPAWLLRWFFQRSTAETRPAENSKTMTMQEVMAFTDYANRYIFAVDCNS
jgi:hypothetical protein